jgi:hypothetical protein
LNYYFFSIRNDSLWFTRDNTQKRYKEVQMVWQEVINAIFYKNRINKGNWELLKKKTDTVSVCEGRRIEPSDRQGLEGRCFSLACLTTLFNSTLLYLLYYSYYWLFYTFVTRMLTNVHKKIKYDFNQILQ